MMRTTDSGVCAAVTALCLVAGCAPELTVRHVMPAGLPLPPEIALMNAGTFTVRAEPKGDFAALASFAQETLAKRLADVSLRSAAPREGAEITPDRCATVGGTIHVSWQDQRGRRVVRRRGGEAGELKKVELPSLIREVDVRVEFAVRRASGGEALGAAEVRRSYNSAADPRVRGELGLGRADDPSRVPAADDVLKELMSDCIEAFCRLAQPVEVTARLALRGVSGQSAEAGLKAARDGQYPQAAAHFAEALRAKPEETDLHFNLAATAEVGGDLETALKHYEQARGTKPPDAEAKPDAEAEAGALRVGRVLAARKRPKL
jgi:hypothetical protein